MGQLSSAFAGKHQAGMVTVVCLDLFPTNYRSYTLEG